MTKPSRLFASRSNANSKPNLRPARSAPWKCSVVSDTADVVVRVEVPADVLGAVLAAIDKGKLGLQLDDVAHRARHGNSARVGQALDAGGKVHAVAEDAAVLLINDDLAKMHADAEHQPPLLVQHLILVRHAFLDIDRRRDRGSGRSEFGQQGIANAVDQRAAGDFDGRPDLGLRRFEMSDGEVLVALHQADEAGDVGVKDRGETALTGCHLRSAFNIELAGKLSSRRTNSLSWPA
jgi:hypothetical protein